VSCPSAGSPRREPPRRRAALLGATALAAPVAIAVLLTSALPAAAQNWTGTTSTNWFVGTNWSTGTVPANGDQPTIDTTTPNAPVINGAAAPAAGSLTQIFIGESATGALTIQGGGTLSTDNGFLGDNAGSNGTATVTGAGSSWTSTNASTGTAVGFNGTGTFNVQAGGTVNTVNTILGFGAASSGTVTVDGAGSIWKQTGAAPLSALFVGYGGTGLFTAQNGSQVQAVDTYVGHLAGSNGTATVTGPGSTWTGTGSMYVGNFGTGTFNVLVGGGVTAGGKTIVGVNTGTTGTVNVDGLGSTWTTTGATVVGGNLNSVAGGTGIFNVTNGGAVTASSDTSIGNSAGSNGTVKVNTGATWTNTGDIYVGAVRRRQCRERRRGQRNGKTYVGFSGTTTGTVTVDGATSKWLAAGNAYIGGNPSGLSGGNAVFNVSSGGAVTTSTNAFIGFSAGSTGTVTVNGTGSAWTSNGTLVIGGNDGSRAGGTGIFKVQNGAALITTQAVVLGNDTGHTAKGTLNIDGATTVWTASNDVTVGETGTGNVNITNGGRVNASSFVTLGDCFCGSGTVTVNGAGSTWSGTGTIYVGFSGTGTFNVENGGTASSGVLYVGADTGSNGTVTVTGANSSWTTSSSSFIGFLGTGTFNVLNGASASLGDIAVGSGTSSGTLKVDATSSVTGTSYSQSSNGTFRVGVSPTTNGKITVSAGGSATLDGALQINAKTTQAKTYILLHADGGIFGPFATVTYTGNLRNPGFGLHGKLGKGFDADRGRVLACCGAAAGGNRQSEKRRHRYRQRHQCRRQFPRPVLRPVRPHRLESRARAVAALGRNGGRRCAGRHAADELVPVAAAQSVRRGTRRQSWHARLCARFRRWREGDITGSRAGLRGGDTQGQARRPVRPALGRLGPGLWRLQQEQWRCCRHRVARYNGAYLRPRHRLRLSRLGRHHGRLRSGRRRHLMGSVG
jgi:T5SS/PEP-CTERM-associated repeat protein